ncbi:MAG: ATP-grasp domain-containing protein [Proteobacteria bacterium]|nr:ATP-grasp domain-containing protein [Pseudomonadota bacterium]MBK8956879.1 ATP-grasp domain-containing protein [Pseudomonadota bacterium]
MFDSILVANRGEIACRVIRTARKLGLRTIAVYHHEDRHAPHVQLADVAVELVADVPTAGYLDIPQLLDIAKAQGAQCIHPGYGFLSENAKFAEAVENAGLAFVGPQSEVIRLMGDKIHSREFAVKAGVPVSPSVKQEGDLDSFVEQASKIGFPLLIKAAAGGGGKGMSIVRSSGELAAKARTAMGEAERYFADGRVYAERYIERPRHIEVQVMGDGQGNVVHLFERECSVQRRFQKIIEESPAPSMPKALRDRICKAAVELAASAKYRNAGTVEFILAPDGEFYFLEMNTRLQVEHPVTEMVCGVDLVEAQLRVAAGLGLPWKQADIKQRGHAIECRICCEEPEHEFRPATGVAQLLRIPDGEGVRFDGGIRQGQAITAAFDSMVGKLVCHGATRDAAVDGIVQALDDFVLLGVSNNIDYLGTVLRHAAFRAGQLHTGFITEHAADLAPAALDDTDRAALLIAAALGVSDFRRLVYETPEPYASIGGWRN